LLLVVDHQVGLFHLVRDFAPEQYRNNIFAHAAIGKLFNLPTVLTSSSEFGMFFATVRARAYLTHPLKAPMDLYPRRFSICTRVRR
jgi:hypothetical protein